MSEHRDIPEPGETIYSPRPSWAPPFFALGALGLVSGIFAAGFMFSPYIYAVVGAIVALIALRSMARGAMRDYFRMPRKQQIRGEALPVETITEPPQP